MALALACEASFFKHSIFETRYTPVSHSQAPLAIRRYIRDLWILSYYYTRLDSSLYINILRHVIGIYDGGFRMPKNEEVSLFPKAVPLEYYKNTEYSKPSETIPKTNTFYMHIYPNNAPVYKLVTYGNLILAEHESFEVYAPGLLYRYVITCARVVFYSGSSPVYWENSAYILIGTRGANHILDFVCICKKSGRPYTFNMCDAIDKLKIPPYILVYLSRPYNLRSTMANMRKLKTYASSHSLRNRDYIGDFLDT